MPWREHRRAIELAERGLVLSRTWNIVDWMPTLNHTLGSALRLSGRADEAVVYAEQAVAVATIGHRSVYLIGLGDAYLAVGRIEDARRCAEEAIAVSHEQGNRRDEAGAFRLFGDIVALSDPPDPATAEMYYRQAFTIAGELGLRPLVAYCHLSFGHLGQRTGKRVEAQEHLNTAATMYREMGITYRLNQAEAELKLLG